MFLLAGTKFRLVRVGMVRAACPQELAMLASNAVPTASLVIVENKPRLGKVEATGYVPDAILASGAAARKRLLDAGHTRTWAYVQATVDIKADDEMSSAELMSRLELAMRIKLYGTAKGPGAGQEWFYIYKLYPFENYFVYSYRNTYYRQGYVIDPMRRGVVLAGEPVRVLEKFVDAGDEPDQVSSGSSMGSVVRASGGFVRDGVISACVERLLKVQTGVRFSAANIIPFDSVPSVGAPNSELVTQVIRDWTNITKAADEYIAYYKGRNTVPMYPSWAPVRMNNTRRGTRADEFGTTLLARGIDPFEFAIWSCACKNKKTKLVDGKQLNVSAFAYVGNAADPTTWCFPLHTPKHTRAALVGINASDDIPVGEKSGVLARVRKIAAAMGVRVPAITPVQFTAPRVVVDPLAAFRRSY